MYYNITVFPQLSYECWVEADTVNQAKEKVLTFLEQHPRTLLLKDRNLNIEWFGVWNDHSSRLPLVNSLSSDIYVESD